MVFFFFGGGNGAGVLPDYAGRAGSMGSFSGYPPSMFGGDIGSLFNNYEEQALLNKLAGLISRKQLMNSALQHQQRAHSPIFS